MKAKELESGNQTKHYVVSIDMGSPGSKEKESKFAWCDNGENREGNLDIDKLIPVLSSKTYFAMGIEAPLFIPMRPNKLNDFTGAREGIDGNHPWSAKSGAYVTAINLGFLASLLTWIHQENHDIAVTTDMEAWEKRGSNCILIWESFISGRDGSEKSEKLINPHIADAQKALDLFEEGRSFVKNLSSKDYLNLPLAIANGLGIMTIEPSTVLIVKGEKPC